jgi:hypothetical protein
MRATQTGDRRPPRTVVTDTASFSETERANDFSPIIASFKDFIRYYLRYYFARWLCKRDGFIYPGTVQEKFLPKIAVQHPGVAFKYTAPGHHI